jgi:hypothetical protein
MTGPDFGAGGALAVLPSTATGHAPTNRAARIARPAKRLNSLIVAMNVCSRVIC